MKSRANLFSHLGLGLVLLLLPQPVFAQGEPIKAIELTQPPLDYVLLNRIWEILKKEVGAPKDFPPPPLTLDWEVPPSARMGYQYPTAEHPENRSQISLAPRTLDMFGEEMLLFGISHELTHYLFLLKHNEFDVNKKFFDPGKPQHCDPEYQRVMRIVTDVIWDIYQSDPMRNQMHAEIRRSCAAHPGQ